MEHTTDLIPRILRDMDDGVLALDQRGHIIYINPQCRQLLNLQEDDVGKTYAEVLFDTEQRAENDAFHQLVLDAVYKKEQTHYGSVSFTNHSNSKMYLRITSSFLKSEEGREASGVVLVISDVTATETYRKKRDNAAVLFFCTIATVCLYLLLLALLDFLRIDVPTKLLTQVINASVFAAGIVIYKKTDVSFHELGLGLPHAKKTISTSLLISLAGVTLLVAAKGLLLRIFPEFFAEGTPFWRWDIGYYSWISYIFTCIIQEFLARSMIYGSIRKLFDGKRGMFSALLLSSLLFGAVHIAHGFLYMAAAILLLGTLGGLYEKQRSIWGVTIIHYVVGQAAACLGFLS